MNSASIDDQLRKIAQTFLSGDLPVNDFFAQISLQTPIALADATVDVARWGRCGYPEVIYAAGKSTASLLQIMQRLCDVEQPILATRVNDEQAHAVLEHFAHARHNPVARTLRIDRPLTPPGASEKRANRDEGNAVASSRPAPVICPLPRSARDRRLDGATDIFHS